MIYISSALKREDIAPFANLFTKHVGNLNERFKLSEATYDRFLDKFIELKHQLKWPPIVRNESQAIEVLSVKIAELLTRQEQLQAELKETKTEPSNTTKCQIVEKSEKLEPREDCLVEIDTVKLAAKANNLRLRLGMPMKSLAKKINLSEYYLYQLVHNPDPWCMLKRPKKVQYGKIEEWYTRNEHAVRSRASEQKRGINFLRRGRRKLLNTDVSLNTVEVSKRVEEILRVNRIDFCRFARWKLYVSKAKLAQLFCQPEEWAKLSETDKQTYARMQIWSLATADEIVALKESLTDRMRLYKAKQMTMMLKSRNKAWKVKCFN
jgi:hypothetical protein